MYMRKVLNDYWNEEVNIGGARLITSNIKFLWKSLFISKVQVGDNEEQKRDRIGEIFFIQLSNSNVASFKAV